MEIFVLFSFQPGDNQKTDVLPVAASQQQAMGVMNSSALMCFVRRILSVLLIWVPSKI